MGDLATVAIRPFVPGGKDYALSRSFYEALGFDVDFEGAEVTGFSCASGGFILQNYHHEGWAGNFMMQLVVENLDAWWAKIEALDLPGRFGVAPPRPPALQPWGLTLAYVFGPSGELWHIVQA
jgi:hypothetical protein